MISKEQLSKRLRTDYTKHYSKETFDSPPGSTIFLGKKLLEEIGKREERSTIVLDLGSGVQNFERDLLKIDNGGLFFDKDVKLITLDIADLTGDQLLADEEHIQGNGQSLPFPDDSLDIIVSNHAMDFIPGVFPEVNRVLKPGGVLLANLHHPSLVGKAKANEVPMARKLRSIEKRIKYKKKYRSTSLPELEGEYQKRLDEYNDVRFIIDVLARTIFTSCDNLSDFLNVTFRGRKNIAQEIKNGYHKWYYIFVKKPK